jgi:hypothetical protein
MRNSNLDGKAPAFYFFNNKLHFQQFGVDTLYILKNSRLEPYAIFNLGKNKMDPNIIFGRSHSEFQDKLNQIKDQVFLRKIAENKDYLFVTLKLGLSDSSMQYIFNKRTSTLTNLGLNNIVNDIDGGLSFWPRYIYNDSILVDYIDAYKLVPMIHDKQSKNLTNKNAFQDEKFNSLSETSNPILIILK